LVELASPLAEVALDITDDVHIRAQAASAVSRISNASAKARLKPLVTADHEEDADDELKGYALRALWPDLLSISELLRSLTLPKNSNFFGAYAFFLIELEVPTLSESDAIKIIDWMARSLRDERHHSTFDRLIPKFLAAVLGSSDINTVRNKLAEFLLGAVRDGAYWSYGGEIQKSFATLGEDKARSRPLIVSIIHQTTANTERDQAALLGGPISLLTKDDLPWLVTLLIAETREEVRRSLANVIVGQTFGRPLEESSLVWDAADDYPFLSEALARAYSIELSSAVAKWQREDFERKKRRADEEQGEPFEVVSRIENDLSKIETENSLFEVLR